MIQQLYSPAAGAAGLLLGEKIGNAIGNRIPGGAPPALTRFGLPAAVFLLASFVGRKMPKTAPFAKGAAIGAAVHFAAAFITTDYDLASY